MRKTLLTIATAFYIIASIIVIPLGFATMEPSRVNLFLIIGLFVISTFGAILYYGLLKEEKDKQFNADINQAFKQLERQEMKARFKQLDKQGA